MLDNIQKVLGKSFKICEEDCSVCNSTADTTKNSVSVISRRNNKKEGCWCFGMKIW